MLKPFLEALDERVLVCDGAMGTMLYAKGVFINKSFDALNLTQPDLVGRGAPGVRARRRRHHRDQHVRRQPHQARIVRHRRQAARRSTRRGRRSRGTRRASRRTSPARSGRWASASSRGARPASTKRASTSASRRRRSLDGGVDLFILETFRDLNEIGAAIDAVRSVTDLPIVAQMTTEEDGNTLDGTPPEKFAPELERRGATLIGVNCAVGPAPMLETIERMAAVTKLQLSAQPNAGKPRDVEGRNIYLCSPEYMASYARRFILHNVRIVGGCCGTTPEHIRQIKMAVRALAPAAAAVERRRWQPRGGRAERPAIAAPPVPREQKSRLAHAMARGTFVIGGRAVAAARLSGRAGDRARARR